MMSEGYVYMLGGVDPCGVARNIKCDEAGRAVSSDAEDVRERLQRIEAALAKVQPMQTIEVDLSPERLEAYGLVSCPFVNSARNTCKGLRDDPDHCVRWDDEREVAVLNQRCPLLGGAVLVRRK